MLFWTNVKARLAELNISQEQMCAHAGIPVQSLRNQISLDRLPKVDAAVKIATELNTTVEQLFNGQRLEDIEFKDISSGKIVPPAAGKRDFLVPLLGQTLSAGHGQELPDEDSPSGYMPIPHSLRRYGERLARLIVNGDSMEPTLRDGDQVICDSCGWDEGEGIYAIQLNGSGYIKRIQAGAGKLMIKSDNPRYDTITEPLESENVRIIGRVHYVIRHLS